MTMRTPLLATVILLSLAAVPAAAADREVDLDVALATDGPAARARTGDHAVASPTTELPEPPLDAAGEPPLEASPDLIELTGVKADASGDAAGVSFGARASAIVEKGEEIARSLAPVVEDHAPEVVATAGLFALLQAMGVWRFLGLAAVGLYTRLAKSELLDNEHRDKVYKLIQSSPGMGVSQIAEATGLGWGTTVYHLDRLERAGFVSSERGGLHRCYFPVGTMRAETRKGMGALKADTTRSIAEFLVTRPGATQSELCAALGLSPSAASKQVSKLEDAGLVRREREWKTVRLVPSETLPALLTGEAASAPAPAPGLVGPLAA